MRSVGRGVVGLVLVLLCVGAFFFWNPLWFADQAVGWKLWRAGVSSREVVVDGYRIHYLEAMPAHGGAGEPLILIHGLGARGEDWAGMIPALAAAGFHVYAPDLLGYGRSDRPDVNFGISLEERTVVGFMTAVGVPRADVGGWSMGGWIAMKLALDHPDRVSRLVIYDSAGVYFPRTFDTSLFTPTTVAGVRALLVMLTPRRIAIPDWAARAVVRRLRKNAWVVKRSVAEMESARDLLEFRVQDLQEPMLIVWGSEDELIPIASGEKIHKAVPQSHLAVVEGCGHLAPLECSGRVLKATLGFLQSEPAQAGGMTMYPVPPGREGR